MLELKAWIATVINFAIAVAKQLKLIKKDVSTINIDLSKKVDKITGKGLSANDYTTAEKQKLAGLESSHFKGEFTSESALKTAFPTAVVGDYANVDLGAGKDVMRYIYDVNDKKWIQQIGASTQLTASEIKQLYESNPDTNAYTNAEKTKLAGVEAGAQKNTVLSVNGKTGAVVVTKTDVGLANTPNAAFATSEENIAGTSTVKITNPAGVAEYIKNQIGTADPLKAFEDEMAKP